MGRVGGCAGCWRGRFMSCLHGCCSTCLGPSTSSPAPNPRQYPNPNTLPPQVPGITLSEQLDAIIPGVNRDPDIIGLPQLPEITLEQLDAIIPLISQEVDRLDPMSTSSTPISQNLSNNLLAQWEKQKQMCSSFLNSIPKDITDEVAGNARSLFMPLLTKALGEVGGVHWLGVGFAFIAWSLDSINNITQNREDCVKILRRSLRLLRNTKQIWQATNIDNATGTEDLRDSVEKAFRCAIFCTSTITDAWILRFLKAATVKDAVAMFMEELDRANNQNIEFMIRNNLQAKVERQLTYRSSDDDTVGGQDVIKDAVTYLETSSDEIRAICLHGMGGIGKSSLGLKIFTNFQKSKYRDCRVELELETKQDQELCNIQTQIIEKVCKHVPNKFSNLTDGRHLMEKELKQINVPIFLYVDNVMKHEHLSQLLPKASFFPKGSRILITSRVENIRDGIVELGITDCKLIEVRKLQKQQAQQVLWKQLKSEGEHRDNSEVESLEERVLELCDGLPLALTVVGKYIAANKTGLKNVEVWREVVEAMQNAEPLNGDEDDTLYSRIMFSIKNLDPNVKRAFLDIIFYVETFKSLPLPLNWGNLELDWGDLELPLALNWGNLALDWGDLERLVISHRLEALSQRALVQKREQGIPEIHDVIKAKGKRMVEEDKNELRITGMNQFEEHKNTPEKVVALNDVTVDAYLLKKMSRLRLLQNVVVEGECQEIQLRHLRVVNGLNCSTARVFNWSECTSLKQVAWLQPDEHEPSLEVFKHGKLSIEALQLRHWSQLKNVDVIEILTCLKKLELQGCSKIESLPEGISRLTGLRVLDLSSCESLQSIPEGIGSLTGLRGLDLSSCESLQSIPEGIGSLTGLTRLDLSSCESLQSIPEGIGSLTGLTELNVSSCESL